MTWLHLSVLSIIKYIMHTTAQQKNEAYWFRSERDIAHLLISDRPNCVISRAACRAQYFSGIRALFLLKQNLLRPSFGQYYQYKTVFEPWKLCCELFWTTWWLSHRVVCTKTGQSAQKHFCKLKFSLFILKLGTYTLYVVVHMLV